MADSTWTDRDELEETIGEMIVSHEPDAQWHCLCGESAGEAFASHLQRVMVESIYDRDGFRLATPDA